MKDEVLPVKYEPYTGHDTFWLVKKLAERWMDLLNVWVVARAGEAHSETLYYHTSDSLVTFDLNTSPAKSFATTVLVSKYVGKSPIVRKLYLMQDLHHADNKSLHNKLCTYFVIQNSF
jgi:hypothetical protein